MGCVDVTNLHGRCRPEGNNSRKKKKNIKVKICEVGWGDRCIRY
jgi:hypothetical protein